MMTAAVGFTETEIAEFGLEIPDDVTIEHQISKHLGTRIPMAGNDATGGEVTILLEGCSCAHFTGQSAPCDNFVGP